MESLQNIKRRLKGVQNIGQITKAMELVAATKMRRSQEFALNSRPYAFTALGFLAALSALESAELPPILQKRTPKIKKTMLVVATSDKGLAGSFNSAVFREFEKFVKKEGVGFGGSTRLTANQWLFAAVGEKSRSYLERKGAKIEKSFRSVGDYTSPEETKPLAELLIAGFLDKKWDEVIVFSTHFLTALEQKATRRRIFPIDFESLRETAAEIIPKTGRFSEFANKTPEDASVGLSKEYLIEPSSESVLDLLARHLVRMQIYHLILEANASEHSARRAAMKNASDNAEELSADLTLSSNKSRQAAITQQITEIAAGVEALR